MTILDDHERFGTPFNLPEALPSHPDTRPSKDNRVLSPRPLDLARDSQDLLNALKDLKGEGDLFSGPLIRSTPFSKKPPEELSLAGGQIPLSGSLLRTAAASYQVGLGASLGPQIRCPDCLHETLANAWGAGTRARRLGLLQAQLLDSWLAWPANQLRLPDEARKEAYDTTMELRTAAIAGSSGHLSRILTVELEDIMVDKRSQNSNLRLQKLKETKRTLTTCTAGVFLEEIPASLDPTGMLYRMRLVIAPRIILLYLAEQERFTIDLLTESLVVHHLISLYNLAVATQPSEAQDVFEGKVSEALLKDADGPIFSPSASFLDGNYKSPKDRATHLIDRVIRSLSYYDVDVPDELMLLQRTRAREGFDKPAVDIRVNDTTHSGSMGLRAAMDHSRIQSWTMAKHYGKRLNKRSSYSSVMENMEVPLASIYSQGTPLDLYGMTMASPTVVTPLEILK